MNHAAANRSIGHHSRAFLMGLSMLFVLASAALAQEISFRNVSDGLEFVRADRSGDLLGGAAWFDYVCEG